MSSGRSTVGFADVALECLVGVIFFGSVSSLCSGTLYHIISYRTIEGFVLVYTDQNVLGYRAEEDGVCP